VPANVGNPDLGPEVTAELEVGADASWLNDRLTLALTYYTQETTDALFNVTNLPSQGFTGSQARNIGTLKNTGTEIQLNATPLQLSVLEWDVGLSVSLMHSEVVDMGGTAPFTTARNLGSALVKEGQPIPARVNWHVTNPEAIADPIYDPAGTNYIYGPVFPTRDISPSTSFRLPGGIQLSARGEYRGGNYLEVAPMSIGRSVISPQCFPYYVDAAVSTKLKPETPALWRARCTPTAGRGYTYKADYFKLRSVSATLPIGTLVPDAVRGATLTASLNNSWLWTKEIPWMDPELGNNEGAAGFAPSQNERTPAPIMLNFALQVTF
jgi:TonB-dependent starch-binding outer membrane protein SusC